MDTELPEISWWQTTLAAILSVVGFFLLLYVVAPILEVALNIFGRIFIPERLGGGTEAGNPGLLNLAFRAIMASGASALVALAGSTRLFALAHAKTVAVIFALAIVAWGGFFGYIGLSSGAIFTSLVMVVLGVIPPLVVACWAWQEGF